jgi:hypothetical protein
MRWIATMLLVVGMSGFAIPQNAGQDVPADVLTAQQALQNARKELAAAGNNWGGHRMLAIKHVDAAIAEVQKAEQYARAHHVMK